MRTLIAACVAISLAAADAIAQPMDRTTRAVAACAAERDVAVCLLTRLQRGSASFGENPAFANAQALARALDAAAPPRPRDAYYWSVERPRLELDGAVATALEADSRGKSPEEALRDLRGLGGDLPSRSFVYGQIVTANGPALRVQGYQRLWSVFDGASEGVAPPSGELMSLVARAWERDAPDATGRDDQAGLLDLARLYERLGDVRGVERVIAMRPSMGPTFRLRRALANGELDRAFAIAAATHDFHDIHERRLYGGAVEECIQSLLAGRRYDDATVVVDRFREGGAFDEAQSAVGMLAGRLPRDQGRAYVERLDRAARERNARGAAAAAFAIAGWQALNFGSRSEALFALWLPHAAGQIGRNCGGGEDFCVKPYIAQMLRRMDRLNEAARFASLNEVLLWDRLDSYGAARVRERLVGREAWERDSALSSCVSGYAYQRDWRNAQFCLEVLGEAGREPLSELARRRSEQAGPMLPGFGAPYSAAWAAFALAGEAGEVGRWDLADPAFQTAVSLLQTVPETGLESGSLDGTRKYAMAMLRRDGRL